MTLLLILETWMLSYFIRASPLAAIYSVAMLVAYTIVSFFVSNTAIVVARLPVFAAIAGSGNLLFLMYLNMPVILVFASLIDIIISFLAAQG